MQRWVGIGLTAGCLVMTGCLGSGDGDNGGERDAGFDDLLCTDPEFPHGYRCVSTSDEAQACQHKGALAYCCPP